MNTRHLGLEFGNISQIGSGRISTTVAVSTQSGGTG